MFNTLFLKPVRSMPAKVAMNIDGLDMDNIPKHVAIIMDGNGRWAKARGKIRTQGHKVGGNQSHHGIRFFYGELETSRNRSAFYYGVVKPLSYL